MYARLKEFGLTNRSAAMLLLKTGLTFDGRTLHNRIEDSSQLSRRIVHIMPGELPPSLFEDFAEVSASIVRHALQRSLAAGARRSPDDARARLNELLAGPCADQMAQALLDCNIDDAPYRDTIVFIERAALPSEEDRTLLLMMLFVSCGCIGNPRAASALVVDYATKELGAEFHTAHTVVDEEQEAQPPAASLLCLVRISEGRVATGSKMHILHPEGTELGLLPTADHTISDVDPDVSRRHAYVWREEGLWFVRDLGSTNGTRVISGADGSERPVGADAPVELLASDILCLGAITKYLVMPVMGA